MYFLTYYNKQINSKALHYFDYFQLFFCKKIKTYITAILSIFYCIYICIYFIVHAISHLVIKIT